MTYDHVSTRHRTGPRLIDLLQWRAHLAAHCLLIVTTPPKETKCFVITLMSVGLIT